MNMDKIMKVKEYMGVRKNDTAYKMPPLERKRQIITEALQRFEWLDYETAEKIYMNEY